MKVYVINLERSAERRDFMRSQLEALGIDHVFFAAVDAGKGQLAGLTRYDEARALQVLGHSLMPSEVGCFASHYQLWKRCAERGEPLIVMEDDVRVEPGLVGAIELAARHIQQRRFIRLCGLTERKVKTVQMLGGGYTLVRYPKGPRGTQCYALSPGGAQALLAGAAVWIDAVDLYLDGFWLHGVASYAIHPFRVRHEENTALPSLIGDARWAAGRSTLQKLRRELTHAGFWWRRMWFNLGQDWKERA